MVTIEATGLFETNIGTLRPGDMVDCFYVDIDTENKIASCLGVNGTEFDLPLNMCRIIPNKSSMSSTGN